MAKVIIVGCKLPHGITLEHPMNAAQKVELKGLNKALIIGSDHATTEVDGEFWEQWEAANKEFKPLKAGSIFVAKNASEAEAIAKDYKDRKTGFEPMRTDGKDERASGVKTESAKD